MAGPKVGFLRDWRLHERPGGAQEVVEQLLLGIEGVQVVDCPPGGVSPDCDAYVLSNFFRYSEEELRMVTAKPYVLQVFGWWEEGLPGNWRHSLFEGARLVFFNSPLHKERFLRLWNLLPADGHCVVLPCPVKTNLLRVVAETRERPFDCLWYGELHPFDGPDLAARWCETNERKLEMYGIGPAQASSQWVTFRGMFPDGMRPTVLGQHKTFIRFPRRPAPFGLSIVEAYVAGLEVLVAGRIGCLSFDYGLDRVVEECEQAKDRFWAETLEALS